MMLMVYILRGWRYVEKNIVCRADHLVRHSPDRYSYVIYNSSSDIYNCRTGRLFSALLWFWIFNYIPGWNDTHRILL